MELKNRKGESASQNAVSVQAVTIPSPPPEIPSPPPSAFTPPPMRNQEPPKPISQPDRIATRPISTPIPRNTPIPTPTPRVQPTPAMTRPSASPSTGLRPSPSPTPPVLANPTATPTPTAEQVKAFREMEAKQLYQKQMTSIAQGDKEVEKMIQEDLKDPNYLEKHGYKSWEEAAVANSPDALKALDSAALAYNQGKFNPTVVDNSNSNPTSDPSTSPSANLSPEPMSSQPPGDPDGDPDGTGNGGWSDGPSKAPWAPEDPVSTAENKINKDYDPEEYKVGPSSPPIKVPEFKVTLFGVAFEYEGRSFSVFKPNENEPRVKVNHYEKRATNQTKGFFMDWEAAWEGDTNAFIKAIIERYLLLKQLGK